MSFKQKLSLLFNKSNFSLVNGFFFTWMIFVLVCVFWLFQPAKNIKFYNMPFFVENQPLKPGDKIVYKSDYERFTDKPARVVNHLVGLDNEIVYTYPAIDSRFPVGRHTTIVSRLEIPTHIPTGKYKLINVAEYSVNPLKKDIVESETQPFDVINTISEPSQVPDATASAQPVEN